MSLRSEAAAVVVLSLALSPSVAGAQAAGAQAGAVIQPGENLVSDGIPPIPVALAETVARYTEFRSAGFLGWHPTRRELLITTRFADTAQLHEVRSAGGARRQLTFFPDRVRDASWPRRSGDYLVFAKDQGGDEWTQLYRLDLASGAITLVSDGGRSQNGLGPWSHQGDRMAFASTRRNGVDRDVYVVDPKDPASTRLVLEVKGGGWAPRAFSPDDRKLVVEETLSVNESRLWILDLATGEKTLATPPAAEPVAYGDAQWSADGKGLYLTTDRDSEFQCLAYLDLASGRTSNLSGQIPWDVERFALSADGRTVAFVTNEEGQSVLRLLDTASGKARARPQLPPGTIGALEWHENGRDLALTLASSCSPEDVYSLDPQTLEVQRWTESETGGLTSAALSEPELVRWKSFDGRTISGFLYRPPARFSGPRPVIVSIHGGPESQVRPAYLGRQNFFLEELGVALVFPNVRGSTGFGKSFVKLDNGVLREDSVKDVGALLDWIATRPELDASRVMITGGSYGGYMTLASATHFDSRIRCSLSVVGISSFVTFLEHTEGYRRDLRRVEYGDERDPALREHLLRISPLTNARKISKPLFVVQGKNDPRVPYAESEQIVATVKKNGGPVWYLLAKDEGHGFAKKKNQDFQFYATVEFVRRHLLD
jgi:dipeptidyl aminopeptidase/acylaminoacyl peptidase